MADLIGNPAANRGPAASVFALSFHADYRCRHSGVCCSSDWDVPVEVPLYASLADAIGAGRVRPVTADPAGALLTGPDLPADAGGMVARTVRGDCVFYHRPSGLCVVHRDLGESQLPATCRHFPRLAVRDRRGTFISLTHYCPTAAAALFRDDVPIEIDPAPGAFPPADYDGLVVEREAWPPLLHPHMLMDEASYSAWERHMVARSATEGASAESVVASLERDARLLRQHRPSDGSLTSAVAALPTGIVCVAPEGSLEPSLVLYREVLRAVPGELMPAVDEGGLPEVYADLVLPSWSEWHRPLRHYLAAKAFASWTAYQGRGLLTVVRGLEAAVALVRVEAARRCRDLERPLERDSLLEAFRQADFLLNHLAVGEELAGLWSEVEDIDPG